MNILTIVMLVTAVKVELGPIDLVLDCNTKEAGIVSVQGGLTPGIETVAIDGETQPLIGTNFVYRELKDFNPEISTIRYRGVTYELAPLQSEQIKLCYYK